MSAADKAKEIVQDLTGMWWPEGDEDQLREAARAWRTYADDVEDCTAACHKKAQDVIDNNKGQSIDAFETFWRKYHGGGKGYLDDLATAARDMAKALDKFADQIAEAKRKIEHELEIAGAVLVAGTALALFTGGISEVAAAGATEAIVAAASTAGVAVSATVAEIAGTVLATAAIGGIEAITVDVVVAQGGRNLLGDQKGINVAEMQQAGVAGLLMGRCLRRCGTRSPSVQGFRWPPQCVSRLGHRRARLAPGARGRRPRRADW
ncbi:WXG100 family type VII secretion target [Streptomyces lydicus]|uniref:WXG100 family type VII secretion target n=1 Tax=Streptomyces lydicus TaxID=47763 RepID=UPI0037900E2F